MTKYLLLSIRFLGDSYHGLTDNGESAEWPPSPFRVFQALVAGNARGPTLSEPFRNALGWLESLDPPNIITPQAQTGRTLLTYVLNNVPSRSRTPKTIRPTVLNGDRLVQYAWKFDMSHPDSVKYAETVKEAARHIKALGWGIDSAVGNGEIVEGLPPVIGHRVHYRPSNTGFAVGLDLRVPRRESLLSLERAYSDYIKRYESPGITRLESAGAIYDLCLYVVGAARPNVAFRLVNADGDTVSVRHQMIAPLVGLMRALANHSYVVASLGQDVIDCEIKGHPKESTNERVSILPLPTIRNGPTDGRIRRVMLAQSFESNGVLCNRLGRLFDGQELTALSEDDRFPPIFLGRIAQRDTVLPYYTGIARVWASVTPVLLPGYDDRKDHRGDHQKRLVRAEQLAWKALKHAGIDVPACIELSRAPYWTGSLHTKEYNPREKLAHYPRWHIRLTFERPWTGPLAIGAGRHCGFGVFARMDDSCLAQ
jgi:CRISPR-associated protein Csb2